MTTLSASTLRVIEQTAPAVGGALDTITPIFYRRLFAAHPQLETDLFNRTNQVVGEQPRALARSIVAFAGLVLAGDQANYQAVLDRIAHKHASLGVVPGQYTVVHEHLFAAIVEVLGDAVTPEVADAWTQIYWLMAGELTAREARIYALSAVDPGDVWQDMKIVTHQPISPSVTLIEVAPVTAELRPFAPGQYVSVQVELADGAHQIRQYSLAQGNPTPDGQPTWRLGVKRETGAGVPDGEVSNFLIDHTGVGDVLRVSIPVGDVTLDDSTTPVALISAGIGSTPMLGMLQYLAATDSARPIQVLHADRSAADHAFRGEVEVMTAGLAHATLRTWYEDSDGYMDLTDIKFDSAATAYVCGPVRFVEQVMGALTAKGLSRERIRFELFTPNVTL